MSITKEVRYIFSNGILKRKDNTLLFLKDDGKKVFIPVEDTKEIYIFGEVDFNKRVIEFLNTKEIILNFYNHYGFYVGSFYPRKHYNSGYIILLQSKAYLKKEKRLYLAKQFVLGACENSLRILKYYKRRNKDLENPIKEIEELKNLIDKQDDIETLMAIEGAIKKIYYKSFNNIITNKDFKFLTRTKRPPKDYINVLISFVNSIIYNACLAEIYKTYLDPRIGFLHSTNKRRFTLNLDIAEIFKPVIGDRAILSLINKQIIKAKDFSKALDGLFLTDKAKMKLIEFIDDRFKQTIKHKKIKKQVSYRMLIRIELYKLIKHLMDEEIYKPFIMEW